MELQILNNQGKESGAVKFDEALVQDKASPSLLHEYVVAYLAGLRSGTHSTKTKAEVSGGGVKPWRQKGTGRARSGSIRSPLWRHGGVIFGPRPRDYAQSLSKSKKRLAFRMAIKELIEKNKIQVVEPVSLAETKTKHMAQIYKSWGAPIGSLLVVDKIDSNFNRAARNINSVQVCEAATLNAYECLKARRLFITKEALAQLVTRIGKKEGDN